MLGPVSRCVLLHWPERYLQFRLHLGTLIVIRYFPAPPPYRGVCKLSKQLVGEKG
jgi:hypothetical protein